MKRKLRRIRNFILIIIGIAFGLAFLLAGPLLINYMFLTETTGWHLNLTFSAGEMLQYYGAVLGGLITCFAIVTTIHINNKNRKSDWQRQQFERAYTLYHKLPEILAKLELAAIHVQYSVHLDEDTLIETLDTMKESEGALREHHLTNDTYYSKDIDNLLRRIFIASVRCQENTERFLQDKKNEEKYASSSRESMENSFAELRDSIKSARYKILAEINQFLSKYGDKGRD